MRNLAFLFLVFVFSPSSFAQEAQANFDKTSDSKTSSRFLRGDEKEEFQKAASQIDPAKRVVALKLFIQSFPESEQKNRVLGLIASGRAELADKKITNNEIADGIKLFKLAVKEAPKPVSNKLFSGVVLQIPNNLFFRGQQKAALEVAKMVEEKISDNPNQMLALAAFYIGVENASNAIKLANKAIKLAPQTKGVYQTLGLAHRFNFNIVESEKAYVKAVENNPGSNVAKLSLAEMNRANGKSLEAVELYRSILKSDAKNIKAETGLILSLFDAGKIVEAETMMEKSLIGTPNNLFLLVGAAYWYAANDNGEKAVELSQTALRIEPRYTWAYIALAKGFEKKGDPLAAERALLTARQFGNFPTLEYEIANARLAAGFYKDAADELSRSFKYEDGKLKTKLGRRIEVEAEDFTNLLALERQSSIFQPVSADDKIQVAKLKNLLAFTQMLEATKDLEMEESRLLETADEFVSGEDQMKTHRQIFVADQLLEKRKALPKVVELAKEATKGIDGALVSANAGSAILANELYEARRIAALRGEALIVPEIPSETLSSILRGRIEEITGSALFQQEKNEEALVRMKRAASILPKDSVWLRSTMWKTGEILEKQAKPKEALDYYIKGYSKEENTATKKIVIETLYIQLNGSLEGLKERLEAKPADSTPKSIFLKKGTVAVTTNDSTEVTTNDSTEVITNDSTEVITNDSTETKKAASTNNRLAIKIDSNRGEIPSIVPVARDSDKIELPKISEDSGLDASQVDSPKTTPKTTTAKAVEDKRVEKTDREAPEQLVEANRETNNIDKRADSTKDERTVTAKPIGVPIVVIEDKLANTIIKLKTEGDASSQDEKLDESKTIQVKSDQTKTADKNDSDVKVKAVEKPDDNRSQNVGEYRKPDVKERQDAKKETENNKKDSVTNNVKNKNASKTDETTLIDLIATRPRLVSDNKVKDKNADDENKNDKSKAGLTECKIVLSQDVVSIINNGGSLGVLVDFEKKSENTDIKATSSSPEDVVAVFEPGIGRVQRQAFFVIRSITTKQGDFKVKFDTPCGEKEIIVKVR